MNKIIKTKEGNIIVVNNVFLIVKGDESTIKFFVSAMEQDYFVKRFSGDSTRDWVMQEIENFLTDIHSVIYTLPE